LNPSRRGGKPASNRLGYGAALGKGKCKVKGKGKIYLVLILFHFVCFQSERVGEGVYNSIWYDKPINLQHSFKFIIMRAQRPVALSIGPFGTLSMKLFATVHTTVYPTVFNAVLKMLSLELI
jgi:hypothetical protein